MYKYHKPVLDQSSWCFSAKEEPSINIFMLSSVLIEHCELQLSYRKLIKTFLNNFWQFCINFTLFWDSLSQNSCRPTNSCTYRVLANMTVLVVSFDSLLAPSGAWANNGVFQASPSLSWPLQLHPGIPDCLHILCEILLSHGSWPVSLTLTLCILLVGPDCSVNSRF